MSDKEETASPPATDEVVKEESKASFWSDEKGNLKFVNIVVHRPFLVFFAILTTIIILTFLLGAVVFRGGNPFADPAIGSYDLKDLRSVEYDSLNLAAQSVSDAREEFFKETTAQTIRTQEEGIDITYWVWESETTTGVFGDVGSIAAMKEGLALFQDNEDYEKYCYRSYETRDADSDYKCDVPISALKMYYASSWDFDTVDIVMSQLQDESKVELYNSVALCVEYNQYCELIPSSVSDDDVAWAAAFYGNITSIIDTWDGSGDIVSEDQLDKVTLFGAHLMKIITKKGVLDFGYDKDFTIDNPVSLYSRAILSWGGPLEMEGDDDDPDKTKEDQDRSMLKKWIVDNLLGDMDTIASEKRSDKVNSYYFMGTLIVDVLLKIVIADGRLATFSIMFVFFWIRVSVGSWFLAIVGLIEIVLTIPVSWFILNTVFQIDMFPFLNSLCIFIVAAIGADDIFVFMDAYKQSAYMGNVLESLETRMSYVYRRTGTAMLITSATTCSAFLCTLLIPISSVRAFGIFAAIVIFVDYVLVMTLYCTAVVIYHNKLERPGCCPCFTGGFCKTTDPSPTENAYQNAIAPETDSVEEAPATEEKVSAFFRDKVSAFIFNPFIRAGIALAMVGWICAATYFTFQLEATKETEQFLDDSHPLQKSFTILNKAFPTAERDLGLKVFFTWGVGEVDRTGVNLLLDKDDLGEENFLDSFELNEECQSALLDVCDNLKTNADYEPYIKQQNGLGSISCFIEELGAFSVLGSLDNCAAVTSGSWKNETWQVSSDDLVATITAFAKEKSCYSNDGFDVLKYYQDEMGWDGENLKYASVSLENTVLDPFSTKAESVVREQYDKMVEIAAELDESMGDSCGGPSRMTDLDQKFVFMNNQRIYARSALESSILGISIAFTVLLLATRVFHIAFFATLSITCVLISVTGTMVLAGWTIGTTESVLITILAGFSIDYVVHLAHSYTKGEGDTFTRIRFAFEEMGISVLNGMLTSVGASIPMFFCSLTFFSRFSFFLCSTIAFSWIFANFGFMSLLATAKIPIKKKGLLGFSL